MRSEEWRKKLLRCAAKYSLIVEALCAIWFSVACLGTVFYSCRAGKNVDSFCHTSNFVGSTPTVILSRPPSSGSRAKNLFCCSKFDKEGSRYANRAGATLGRPPCDA